MKIYIINKMDGSETEIKKATVDYGVAFKYLCDIKDVDYGWYVEIWQNDELVADNRINLSAKSGIEKINSIEKVLNSTFIDHC